MDEPRIEAAGLTPIAADLATIDDADQSGRSARPRSRTCMPTACRRFFRFGSQTDLDRPTMTIANVDQGGIAPAGSRLLPQRRCAVGRAPREVRRARRERSSTLAGEPADKAAADAAAVLRIETALATASLDRVKRRDPRYDAASPDDQRAAGADAQLQLAQVRDGSRRAAAADHQRRRSRLSDGLRPADRVDAGRRSEDLPALAAAASVGGDAAEGVRRRQLRLLQPHAGRPAGTSSRAGGAASRRPIERLGEALGKAFVDETFSPQAKADTLADGAGHQGRRCGRTSTPRRG